jgi:hypothetical protein
VSLIFAGRTLLGQKLKMGGWFSSKKIPQPRLVEGHPGHGKIVYQREQFHSSQKRPYTFKFTNPSVTTITGIACCPVADEKIQAPEATVTEGGVNCKHVHIYLEPTEKGEWGYVLAISAEENLETKASQQVRIE